MIVIDKIRQTIRDLQEIEQELSGTTRADAPHPDMIATPYEKVFRNARVARVVEYRDGWVPNSRKDTDIGTCRIFERDGVCKEETYDRHRLRGQGPHWRAYSKRGKLLAEG